jgi:hypothetical protein
MDTGPMRGGTRRGRMSLQRTFDRADGHIVRMDISHAVGWATLSESYAVPSPGHRTRWKGGVKGGEAVDTHPIIRNMLRQLGGDGTFAGIWGSEY